MPVKVRRGPVLQPWLEDEYDRAPLPPDTGGSWQSIVDTYATGFWGAVKDRTEETLVRNQTRQRDYDGLDNIPQGYEHYGDQFMWAKSPEEVEAIRLNIDDMETRKRRLAQNGLIENIGYGLVAGILDPVNLIGGPTLKGVGFLKGALLGGVAYGSINAAQELGRNALDATVSDEETLVNVGFGYAFAGLISGASGAFGSKARGPGAMAEKTQKRFDEVGDNYGKAWAASEGKPVDELIDFNGQGVKIVDGPTGKKDANGNPVKAFFRPKEAVERARAREAQAKAVDDALGPVIPNRDAGDWVGSRGVVTNVKEVVGARLAQEDAMVIDERGRIIRLHPTRNSSGDHADLIDAIGEDAFRKLVRLRSFGDQIAWDFDDLTPAQAAALRQLQARARREGVNAIGEEPLAPPPRGPVPDPEDVTIRTDDDVPPWAVDEMDALAEATPIRAADDALDDAAEDAALPFGGTKDDVAPAKGADEPEDTIYVDSAALREDFANKPWTNPREEGVTPLAEDAFETPQEWVNFVVLHELHHKTAKRNEGESKAAYEDRINRLAYEEMKAGRLPLSPTDGALEKLMLLPTPSGTLMRLAPRHAPTHDLAQGVAGDMSTLTIANKAGRPTTPGGSVFQLAHRWLYSHYVHTLALRRSYVEYVKGTAAQSNGLAMVQSSLAAFPKIGSAARQGKLKLAEYNRVYGRAINSDEPFANPLTEGQMAIVRKYAAESRKVLVKFEVEARNLGMFDALKRVQRQVDWRTRANEADRAKLDSLGKSKPGLRAHLKQSIAKREEELAELTEELDELKANPVKPAREDHYFPRIFDINAIKDRFDDFVALLEEGYARDGNPNARANALATANRIVGRGSDEVTFGTGSSRHLRSRQIPMSNDELADFIVWDADVVMGIYARRMGASIEMTRKYGSTMMDEHLDRLNTKLVEDGFDEAKRTKIIHEIEDMRDRVLGRFHASDPLNWQNRTARALKNYGSLTLMGRGIYAQVVDVVRTLASEGYAPLFKAMGAAFDNRKTVSAQGKYSRQAGEGLELVMARWQAMVMENDSALMVTQQSGIERGLAAAQAPFFALNMMNPFTVIWKDFTSLMSGHTLIADSLKIADAVRSGKTMATMTKAEQKLAARLASWGIDLRAAQLIADMPFEKTEGSGLYLANLEAWEGRAGERAREAFMGALSGKIRSNVITPGPLQRAAIMDGVFRWNGKRVEVPLLSLPFQLMSFSMSASAKVSHAILSGRDPKPGVTVAALLAGGYISAWLAAGDRWDNMTWEERAFNAMDRSGMFGWLVDVSRRMDTLAGVGPRSALGLDEFGEDTVSDEIGAVLGPAPGVIAGAFEAFIDNDLTTSQRAGMVRRAVPFSGLVQVNEIFKTMQDMIVGEIDEGGGLDVASQPVPDAA